MDRVTRRRVGGRIVEWVALVLSAAGLLTAVSFTFNLGIVPVPIDTSYLYALLGIYGSLGFLFYRARPKSEEERAREELSREVRPVPWYDWLLFAAVLGMGLYLAWRGQDVVSGGWSMSAPLHATVISLALWAILFEGGRRTGGLALAILAGFFSFYPLLAPHLPGFLWGPPAFNVSQLGAYHLMSNASVMGMPMQVVGQLVFGYVIFGAALEYAGAGKFFLDLSVALMGAVRGGTAKVSIAATGLFGIFTGSAASNVLVTGPTVIPAMKKSGYPGDYAAALVACGAVGGTLSPPIMGAAAFLMAMVLAVPFPVVAAAAIIPSVLFYWGLFVQADAYAARHGLKGMNATDPAGSAVPPLGAILRSGWPYIAALTVLSVCLFYFRWQAEAPFYAAAILLAYGLARRQDRFTLRTLAQFTVTTGKYLAELTLILCVVGFIIGSFNVTGLGGTMSFELTRMAGDNVWLLLAFCAIASFVLGTGLTASVCYIFLAITIAPALVKAGINPIAAHMFILYWGLLSDITPPTAVSCFVAAPIAGAKPMRVAVRASRLGLILYLIPFFFAIDASLVMQGSWWDIGLNFTSALVGVTLVGGSLERYVLGLGVVGTPVAAVAFTAGVMLMYPMWEVKAAAIAVLAVLLAAGLLLRRRAPA